ncbi:uncharacterized protein LOC121376270 [Gigantopelta aegis]|uniref:uncharacterized protein LOC121376270 n=1 Tax=Gigantopelta aegis TaxID=1735272 RepID=UPI001B88A81E|nr:uncharacterized protein LOC121376270 [Gigantopelta aegis]
MALMLFDNIFCHKSIFLVLFATFIMIPNISSGSICLHNTWLLNELEDIFMKFKNILVVLLLMVFTRVRDFFQHGAGSESGETVVILLFTVFGWVIKRLITLGFNIRRRIAIKTMMMVKKANRGAKLRKLQNSEFPYDENNPKKKKRCNRTSRNRQREPLLILLNNSPIPTSNRFQILQCL